MLASAIVRTTGVNWESVAAISAIMGVLIALMTFWITRRDRTQRDLNAQMESSITDAVNHLSDVLMAKLETKETVARISERLARLEGASGVANRDGHDGG